jgi:exonuclease III
MSALKKLMARGIASPAGPRDRAALAKLEAFGLHDVVRERWPKERVFTYWDYRGKGTSNKTSLAD